MSTHSRATCQASRWRKGQCDRAYVHGYIKVGICAPHTRQTMLGHCIKDGILALPSNMPRAQDRTSAAQAPHYQQDPGAWVRNQRTAHERRPVQCCQTSLCHQSSGTGMTAAVKHNTARADIGPSHAWTNTAARAATATCMAKHARPRAAVAAACRPQPLALDPVTTI